MDLGAHLLCAPRHISSGLPPHAMAVLRCTSLSHTIIAHLRVGAEQTDCQDICKCFVQDDLIDLHASVALVYLYIVPHTSTHCL